MKKTKLKALKNLAKRLPDSKELVIIGTLIKGEDVSFNDKIKAGKPIENDNWYKQKNTKLVDIDHYSRLKNAYARNKELGLIEYIHWLDRNNIKLNQMFKDLELERVNSTLMKQIEKGAKGFWTNLIQFLLSFVMAFQLEKKAV